MTADQHRAAADRIGGQLMTDGWQWQKDGWGVIAIIEHLFAAYREQYSLFWPQIVASPANQNAVIEAIVADVLRLDEEHGWNAPRMGDSDEAGPEFGAATGTTTEDRFLAYLADTAARRLFQGRSLR